MLATELPPKPRSRAWEALGIVVLSLVLNLAGNGRTSLWDRDEPRYAECMREMRASGDYLHPRFNAEPRYQKPILIYWLMLGGTAIGGDNPFGARLVSAFAGAMSCLAIWLLGGRMFGPKVGRLAGLIFATAPLAVVNAKLATIDATLCLLLLLCQAALWSLAQNPSRKVAIGFWVALALAMLTKGPVGPALIAASGLASWMLGGPTACWRRLHWRWGLAVFVAIASPWYIAIGVLSRGDFFREAVGAQIVRRMTTGMEQHGGFPGYYPVTALLTFYPWSALLPLALLAAFARRKTSPALGFALGWALGPLILLECVRTKLVHYYLPSYPACALLVAWGVGAIADSERGLRRWPLGRLASGLVSGLGLILVVLAMAGVALAPWPIKWPCLAMAIALGVGTFVACEAFRSGRTERGAYSLAATWAGCLMLLGGWLLPAFEPYRMTRRVAAELARVAAEEHARPILATYQEPSLVYALGSPTLIMHDRTWLDGVIRDGGAAVAAVSAVEKAWFEADPTFSVKPAGSVRGFNLSKGRSESLELVILRRATSGVAARPVTRR